MDNGVKAVTWVSGGQEAGAIVYQVLAAIAAPLAAIGAVAFRSWQLVPVALAAVGVFVVCRLVARHTPHQLRIGQEVVTFTRASGMEASYPKHEVYVQKFLSHALFCVKHSSVRFRFPLRFTTNAESGECLTMEALVAQGIERR